MRLIFKIVQFLKYFCLSFDIIISKLKDNLYYFEKLLQLYFRFFLRKINLTFYQICKFGLERQQIVIPEKSLINS